MKFALPDRAWHSYRFCVTGGAGFLGRCVVRRLIAAGVSRDRIFVPRRAEYDLTDAAAAARLCDAVRPDVIIHLAAEVGGIGANASQPGRFLYANAAMGLHLIECARHIGVRKFVQIGTICSYPKFAPLPFREDDLWNGYPEETNAPYGVAKRLLLTMCQAYRQQYGLNAIYLLPVNLYGPGDNFDPETSHVIPAMIRRFVEARRSGARRVTLWGDGSPTREFLFVEDAAEAIVLAAERYDGAAPVNIGVGSEISIRELAERVRSAVGYDGAIEWDTSRPNGQPRRRLDVSRARECFGFSARISLDEGLRRTIDWYLAHIGV